MSGWKAKRFWTVATVEPCDGGFTVRLDGRAVKTPAKAPVVMPTQAMAEAAAHGPVAVPVIMAKATPLQFRAWEPDCAMVPASITMI